MELIMVLPLCLVEVSLVTQSYQSKSSQSSEEMPGALDVFWSRVCI